MWAGKQTKEQILLFNLAPKLAPEVERVSGIEPPPSAWKAEVLPLNYTRLFSPTSPNLVEGVGFEPTKAIASRFTVCPRWPLGYPSAD
jgi:hypothetical protein